MGKGDWKRPTDKAKFDEGYEAIFGKRELKTWNPEEDDEQTKPVQSETEGSGRNHGATEAGRPHPSDPDSEDGSHGSDESPGSREDGGVS